MHTVKALDRFHHQAQRQRLARLARARYRGGNGSVWHGQRSLAGWRGAGEGVTDPATAPSAAPYLGDAP